MNTNIELSAQIMRFMNQLIFLEKKSVFTHKGVTLYPSELHLMAIILKGKTSGATAMAEKLGITKGAVSQTLSRLEKKNIITKTKDPFSKNELTVEFTPLGSEALEAFALTRNENQKKYSRYLSGLTSSEKKTLQKFLTQMENFLSGLK